MTKHTPTPWSHEAHHSQDFRWIKDATGHTIASTSNERFAVETAALIVRAVNAHESLVAALQATLTELTRPPIDDPGANWPMVERAVKLARAALAKASQS